MASSSPDSVRLRFGPFALDPEGRELLENCNPLHIAEQQMTLLLLLARHAGELVTRQQVQAALWPEGTFVDFERGINSAVRRLRVVLHDEDEQPRYIATVPGRGYRWIAPLERPAEPPVSAARQPRPGRWWPVAVILAVVGVMAGWAWVRLAPGPQVLHVRALTTDGGMDLPARPASFGPLIYYLDRAGGHWTLMSSSGNPASARAVAAPFRNTRLIAISREGTEWLLGEFQQRGEEANLWTQARPGGAPVRLGNVRAYDAVWDPDGAHIEYSHNSALWQAAADGSGARQLGVLPGSPDWLSWSPDGKALRFFAGNQLWEWRPGEAVRALPFRLPRCCGAWSQDGRYFFFSAQESGGLWTLWAQRVAEPWPLRLIPGLRAAPVQLISLPRDSFGAYTGFGHNQVVFYESDPKPDSLRCEPSQLRCQPLLPGRSATDVDFAPGARQLVYRDSRDQSIWAADIGSGLTASNFRRLSPEHFVAGAPEWSRDGRWVAFSGQTSGQFLQIYRMQATGGPLLPLVAHPAANTSYGDPSFSPDGQSVAADSDHGDEHGIVVVTQGRIHPVPGSGQIGSPQWSPDDHWLSGVSADQTRVEVYNISQRRWLTVAQGQAFSGLHWSADGRYLYYQDLLAEGEPVYRAERGSWKIEPVANFTPLLRGDIHRCAFMGLTPAGELMVAFNNGSSDLYAATVELP